MGRRLIHNIGYAVFHDLQGFRVEPEGQNHFVWSLHEMKVYTTYQKAAVAARSCNGQVVRVTIKILEDQP